MQGRPGPVVIALPEDMLLETAEVVDARARRAVADLARPDADGGAAEAAVGREVRRSPFSAARAGAETACAACVRFAERFELPVATSFRRAMLFPNDHPNYAGELGIGPNPKLQGAHRERRPRAAGRRPHGGNAVAILHAVRHSRCRARRSCMSMPTPTNSAASISRRSRINATPHGLLRGARKRAAAGRDRLGGRRREQAHDDYRRLDRAAAADPRRVPVRRGADAGCANDCRRTRSSPTAPATTHLGRVASCAIRRFGDAARADVGLDGLRRARRRSAPSAQFPERTVVCFAGDGCFLMNGQEFATAVQYDLPIVVVVVDNGMYGTIRMHQEREYPGRISARALKNPDFAAYARAFGGHGETVRDDGRVHAGVRARGGERQARDPALLKIDPEAITPATTLTKIREAAEAKG